MSVSLLQNGDDHAGRFESRWREPHGGEKVDLTLFSPADHERWNTHTKRFVAMDSRLKHVGLFPVHKASRITHATRRFWFPFHHRLRRDAPFLACGSRRQGILPRTPIDSRQDRRNR